MFAGELKQLFPSTFTQYEPDEVFLGLLFGCIFGKFNYVLIIFTSSMPRKTETPSESDTKITKKGNKRVRKAKTNKKKSYTKWCSS